MANVSPCINRQGDFIFIPKGVPHQPCNLSLDTEAVALVARNDANEQESIRLYAVRDTE